MTKQEAIQFLYNRLTVLDAYDFKMGRDRIEPQPNLTPLACGECGAQWNGTETSGVGPCPACGDINITTLAFAEYTGIVAPPTNTDSLFE